jgi:hypothetical protein
MININTVNSLISNFSKEFSSEIKFLDKNNNILGISVGENCKRKACIFIHVEKDTSSPFPESYLNFPVCIIQSSVAYFA